ncbi:hypothetical protein PRIPAC_80696, partial [Pristionchus pacificus]|uniref:Uncharacterized protein n=1 Tax=Pristionchus pacificus TaxID=54126 RepID=A0A8R1YKT1_PRIPA
MMGAVLSGVRRRSSLMEYNRDRDNAANEHRAVAPLVSRAVSPHVSSFERSRKFRKSIDTSQEDRSSLYSQSAESESFENEKKKKDPSSHSSDTSYRVKSLPKIKDYRKWCKDNVVEDTLWIEAVRAFNARQKTWKRKATPARSLRRMGFTPTGLKWTQCAREVYRRGPPAEWVVAPNLHQEQQLRKYKQIDDDVDSQGMFAVNVFIVKVAEVVARSAASIHNITTKTDKYPRSQKPTIKMRDKKYLFFCVKCVYIFYLKRK